MRDTNWNDASAFVASDFSFDTIDLSRSHPVISALPATTIQPRWTRFKQVAYSGMGSINQHKSQRSALSKVEYHAWSAVMHRILRTVVVLVLFAAPPAVVSAATPPVAFDLRRRSNRSSSESTTTSFSWDSSSIATYTLESTLASNISATDVVNAS